MASKYWVGGSGSKSFSDSANWSNTRGGAGGAGIANTNDAYIEDSDSIIDSGLSNGSLTLNSLTVRGGRVTIGSQAGSALTLAGITTNFVYAGRGSICKINPGTIGGDVKVGRIGDGRLYFTGGTVTGSVYAGAEGVIDIASGVTIPLVRSAGASIVGNVGAVVTAYELTNASLQLGHSCTNLRVYNGGNVVAVDSAAVTGTLLNAGGFVLWLAAGTVANWDARADTKNSSSGSSFPFTISASIREPRCVFFDNDQVQPTFSAPTVLVGYGA